MAAERWRPAYVGIGSNLGQPRQQLAQAFAALNALDDSRAAMLSPVYASAPVGPADQPDYLNAVAALMTRLDAHALLTQLLDIELAQGRQRDGQRWGARVIDLDLLMLSDDVIDSDTLTLPHPRIAERRFVVQPWLDLCPTLTVPGVGPLSALLPALAAQRVERLAAGA